MMLSSNWFRPRCAHKWHLIDHKNLTGSVMRCGRQFSVYEMDNMKDKAPAFAAQIPIGKICMDCKRKEPRT